MPTKSLVVLIAASSVAFITGGIYFLGTNSQTNGGPCDESVSLHKHDELTSTVSREFAQTINKATASLVERSAVIPARQDPSWGQIRGDNGQGDATASVIPITWSDDRNIAWKTRLIGRGASSPIIVGENVFLTAYTGYCMELGDNLKKDKLRQHVICLDRLTGKQKWIRTIQGSPASQGPNPEFITHGFASSTPATDGERVYAFFGATGVFAFDIEGNYIWQVDVGSGNDYFGSSASPRLFENLLIVNASLQSGRLYALDKLSGKVAWIFDDVKRTWSTPSIGKSKNGRVELVMNQSFFVNGIDPMTGEKLWTVDGIQDYVVPIPVIHEDIAYISGGRNSRIMAIKLGGSGDVTESHKLWESPLNANVPSPIVHENTLCVVGENRILQQYNILSGKQITKARVGGKQSVFAPLVKTRDYFYLATPGVGISVVERNGNFKVVATNQPDAEDAVAMSAVAICGNNLFYRTDDWIYCVGKTDKPARQQAVSLDESVALLIPKQKTNLDPVNNKPKTYLRYMSGTKSATAALVLRPYDSVISEGEEREGLTALVESHWNQYIAIRADEKAILLQQNRIPDEEYIAAFADIEMRMSTLDKEVRKKIRARFSKEQMAKHIAEYQARLKSQNENTNEQPKQ